MTSSLPTDDSSNRNSLGENDVTDRPKAESGAETPDDGAVGSVQEPYPAEPVRLPPVMPRKKEDVQVSEASLFNQLWLPVFLLAATCLSTFFAGAMTWQHDRLIELSLNGYLNADLLMTVRQAVLRHAGQGFVYMICVVGILFAHEMGHYIATRIYKVPASYPYFIPFVLAPIGTMGAVIAMQGHKANRKEIFDIGIAGPLAGLVLAIPIVCVGVARLDLTLPAAGSMRFDMPLLVRWMFTWFHPGAAMPDHLYAGQLNAMFMAGWVGLLITGLNMLPLSQLDGGHVTYTLFGKSSRVIARVFVGIAIAYMVYKQVWVWTVMLLLIFAIGIYHPPTSDDSVPLGRGRIILGVLSLLIPVLCFPPRGLAF